MSSSHTRFCIPSASGQDERQLFVEAVQHHEQCLVRNADPALLALVDRFPGQAHGDGTDLRIGPLLVDHLGSIQFEPGQILHVGTGQKESFEEPAAARTGAAA